MIPVFGNTKCSAAAICDKQLSLKRLSQSFSQQTFNNFKIYLITKWLRESEILSKKIHVRN